MFFLLEIKDGEKSFRARISDYFNPADVSVQKVEMGKILPFYKITAVRHRGEIPWKEIENAAGRFCHRAIINESENIPDSIKIKKYEPVVFPVRVLFNSAVSVLEKLRLDPIKMSITVFDENGYLTDMIESLVKFCSSIRIVTSCIRDYEALRDALLIKYGISVIITPKTDNIILTSTAIISDKSNDIPLIYHGLLFTNERRKMLNASVLCGKNITLPKEIEYIYDPQFDKMTFASALYELCGAKILEKTLYDDM